MMTKYLRGKVSELPLHPLSNGSQQIITRVVAHDSVCIHYVRQGLRPQLEVGLILGDPLGEAVYRLLGKCLQQGPDLDWIIADLC